MTIQHHTRRALTRLRTPLLAAALAAFAPATLIPTAAAADYFVANKASTYPISDAVQVGKLLYLSGKLGIDPATGKLAEGGITAEAKQAMEIVRSTLAEHKLAPKDVVKCTIFLADIKDLAAFNEVYKTYFAPLHYPARSAVAVNGLALGAQVEVECIASLH